MKLSEEMLLHLKLADGISNLQIWKIVKAIASINYNFELNVEEIAKLANLTKTRSRFIASFNKINEKDLLKAQKTHQILTIYDQEYPAALKTIYNAPTLLFYQGNLSLLKGEMISFVGAREATAEGLNSCLKLIRDLPKSFVIVSGGARGIDTMSHKAAIKHGKKTICVIGSGLNVDYPRENQNLFENLKKNELIISEYFNNELPLRHHFPERNRIIAGLSIGTVVVEAKERSGSLITSDRALEEGREVFAVPGSILQKKFNGCHHLIQQGAKCVYQAQDILDELKALRHKTSFNKFN